MKRLTLEIVLAYWVDDLYDCQDKDFKTAIVVVSSYRNVLISAHWKDSGEPVRNEDLFINEKAIKEAVREAREGVKV